MSENKTGKYFKYALGEILLVMLGILLALQVNNWNEERKSNIKFKKLLVNVFDNLETDLDDVQRVIDYYTIKDTIATNVIDGKYSESDYRENARLFGLIFSHAAFNITDNGYNALMQNSEDIPDGYDQLVTKLNNLYIKEAKQMDNSYISLTNTIDDAIRRYTLNFPWYSQSDSISREKRIQHYVNNPIYKNEAAAYRSDACDNYADEVKWFFNDGIHIYLSLKEVLKEPSKLPDFVPENAADYEILKSDYLGSYSVDNQNLILKEMHNYLIMHYEGGYDLLFMDSKDKFKNNTWQYTINFKRNELNKVVGFKFEGSDVFFNKVETED